MGAVAKRYAKALFEVAKADDQLTTVEEELGHLNQLFDEHPDFLKLIHHPNIEQESKKKELDSIFGGQLSDSTFNFLHILVDRGREDELEAVMAHYVELANKERGLEDAFVYTAQPLTEAEQEELSRTFGQITGKQIRVQQRVDEDVLGGVRVKIGDRVYDGSVQGKLNRFKQRVIKSKS